jgi:uncharacterized protein (DUF2141 family)
MNKLALLITLVACLLNGIAQTGEIGINITNIAVYKGGVINIGVYQENGFPDFGKQVAYKVENVTDPKTRVLLKDIAPGNYAVAVFQDANSDGVLNKNIWGAPTEPYGFSRNNYGKGGPPDFENVSFILEADKRIDLTINLK